MSQYVIQTMKKWVESIVVGHNFCPFAKKEVLNQTIRYQVSDAKDPTRALEDCLTEIQFLEKHPETETTLLIFPEGFPDFELYLDMLEMSHILIEKAGYEGIFQIASFHPDYCFADTEPDDAANYTNKAPFPCLHLLREESLSKATEKYPQPEEIPENNIQLARTLGRQELARQLEACFKQ